MVLKTRCSVGLQLAMVPKNLCNCCKKRQPSSTVSVAPCNFLCKVCCNGVAKQVAGGLHHLTCPLCNLSRNFFGLEMIAQSRTGLYASCSSRLQPVTCLLQRAKGFFLTLKLPFRRANIGRKHSLAFFIEFDRHTL